MRLASSAYHCRYAAACDTSELASARGLPISAVNTRGKVIGVVDNQLMPAPQNVAAFTGRQCRPSRLRSICSIDRSACLLDAHVGKLCQHFACRWVRTTNVRSLTGLPSAGRRSRLPNRSGDLRWRIKGGSSGNVDSLKLLACPAGGTSTAHVWLLHRTTSHENRASLGRVDLPRERPTARFRLNRRGRTVLYRLRPGPPFAPSDQLLVAPARSACSAVPLRYRIGAARRVVT